MSSQTVLSPARAGLRTRFDHLVSSILPGSGQGRLMAFLADFTGYFDDSGTHEQSEVAVAAGYISTTDQWKEFERNWAEVDEKENFGVFRTADCLGGFKQFKDWDEPKKDRVMRKLIGITKIRARQGFISAVVKRDYDEVVPDWLKRRSGKYHYTFCIWSCFAFVNLWRKEAQHSDSIRYVFDVMGKGKGEILSAFDSFIEFGNQDVVGAYDDGISFESKKVVQLQAADMIAYGSGWHMSNRVLKGRKDELEPWFRDLISVRPAIKNRYFDRKNLTEWVERMEKHKDDPNWGLD